MGDRCHLLITVHPDDLKKAIKCNGELHYLDQFEDETVEYEMDEVNYGGFDDLSLLAKAGVRYHGSHGSGGDYPAYDFFSDGIKFDCWANDDHGALAITTVKDGERMVVDPVAIEACNLFLAAQAVSMKVIAAAVKLWEPPADPYHEATQDQLDELVHEAMGEKAAEVNNQGRAKQILWLRHRGISP